MTTRLPKRALLTGGAAALAVAALPGRAAPRRSRRHAMPW